MYKVKNFIFYLVIFLFALSIFFVLLSLLYLPLYGDDCNFLDQARTYEDVFLHSKFLYLNWTGRFIQLILIPLVYKFSILMLFIKILTIVLFFSIIIMIIKIFTFDYHNSINEKKINILNFIILYSLIWFSLPSISENFFWLAGSISYLFPVFFFILSIFLMKKLYLNKDFNFISKKNSIFYITAWILINFVNGAALEQIAVSYFFFLLALVLLNIFYYSNNLPKSFLLGLLPFFLGIFFSVTAPGNYERVVLMSHLSFFDKLFLFVPFILTAFFELGTVNNGKFLWLSIVVLFLVYFNNKKLVFIKENLLWIIASLAAIFMMFNLGIFITLRLTFIPVLLLFIFFIHVVVNNNIYNGQSYFQRKLLVSLILTFLLFNESFTGFITNFNIHLEEKNRVIIVEEAIKNDYKLVKLPFIETIPHRYTYIDKSSKNLYCLNKKYKNIILIENTNDSLPFVENPLKKIKTFVIK